MSLSLTKPLRILGIILAGFLTQRLIKLILKKFRKTIKKAPSESLASKHQRIKTLLSLIRTTSLLVINAVVFLMILSELGLDIMPFLAGVGFVGLAFGFGAKSLVADLIAGFFILLENQFNVGDEIEIAKVKGKVIKITLRTITLKDKEGKVYLVPNSTIQTVTKFPKKTKS